MFSFSSCFGFVLLADTTEPSANHGRGRCVARFAALEGNQGYGRRRLRLMTGAVEKLDVLSIISTARRCFRKSGTACLQMVCKQASISFPPLGRWPIERNLAIHRYRRACAGNNERPP